MITEDYVSFEVAKLLNEKGFKGQGEHFYEDNKITNYINYWFRITPKERYEAIEAPTLQMAMKWLREEHNIHIAINICYTENPELFQPDYYVYVNSTVTGESLIKETCPLVQDNSLTPKGFTSYEQACEAAIKYCIEKLI